jgi:signal transduction histidine kinase
LHPPERENFDRGKALSVASRLCLRLSGSKAVMVRLDHGDGSVLHSMSFSEGVSAEKMSSLLLQGTRYRNGTFNGEGYTVFNLSVPIEHDILCHISMIDPQENDKGNLESVMAKAVRGSFILSGSILESIDPLQFHGFRPGTNTDFSELSYALSRLRSYISDNLLIERLALYIHTDAGIMESGLFAHINPSLEDCWKDTSVSPELNTLLKMQVPVSLNGNVAPAYSNLAKFFSGMIICPVSITAKYVLIFLIDPGDSPFSQIEGFAEMVQRLIRSLLHRYIGVSSEPEITSEFRFLTEALKEINLASDIHTLLDVSFSAISSLFHNPTELCLLDVGNGKVTGSAEFCRCADRDISSAAADLAHDIHLQRAAAEQEVIISEVRENFSASQPASSGWDVSVSDNGLNYLCYIPLIGSESGASTVYARIGADVEYSYLLAALNVISAAARSKSQEIMLHAQLIAERENLEGLKNLINTFSSRNVGENHINSVANDLLSAFSKLTCAAYFKKGAEPECVSIARRVDGPTGKADLSSLEADQLKLDHSGTLIFETGEAEDNPIGKLMISVFGEHIKYGRQTCICLFQQSGTDLNSLLCVISNESVQAAKATASSLKPVFKAVSMLENFRESIATQRSMDSVNRSLLSLFGKYGPKTTLYEMCAAFSRAIADAFGFELAAFYYFSRAGRYKLMSTHPVTETGLNESLGIEDIPLPQHGGYRILQLDLFSGKKAADSFAGLKKHDFRSVLLVSGPVSGNSLYPLFYLLLFGRKAHVPSETMNGSIVRYTSIFGNFLDMITSSSMKSLNFSIGSDLSDLICSAFSTDGSGWRLSETDVSSRFCLLASKATGLSHSALYSLRKGHSVAHSISVFSSSGKVDAALIHDLGKLVTVEATRKEMEPVGHVIQLSPERLQDHPGLSRSGVSTLLIIPGATHDDDSEDVFVCFDTQRKHVSGENIEMAGSIVDTFYNVIESRRNAINASLSLSALSSELRIARNVSSTFELRSILNYSCEEVMAFTSPDIVLIFLLDEGGQLRLEFASGRNKGSIDESLGSGIGRWKLYGGKEDSIVSIMMESGSYFSFEGENSCGTVMSNLPDEFKSAFADIAKGESVRSIVGAPISFAGKFLGAVVCFNIAEGSFRKIDIDFIQTVSAIVSTGIENSRNFRATYDALNKLSRLDTLRSNFSSIAAHELRTPLTSIRVYIELMKLGKVGKFNETEMKNIESLLASVTELNEIITNMLEFTRMEALLLEIEMQPISLVPLVEEVSAMISPQLDAKSISLKLDIQGNLMKVNANYSLIKKVIHNLVSNAVKYNVPGGKIIVTLKNEGDGVMLSVEDTGKGIPEEDIPFIFDRYYVVDASILHSGAGFRFGLPISKLIVERHGGRIWVESKVGIGSIFRVFIPSRKEVVMEEWLSESSEYLH